MSKKLFSASTLIFVIFVILLTACATPSVEEDNPSMMATLVEQTVQARIKTLLAEPTAKEAAPTVKIVSTPISLYKTQSTSSNCLVADLVSETIPDGTVIQKGATFTKTWKIINAGTCSWITSYKLVFVLGDILGAPYEVNLTENVAPGNVTKISLSMVAPSTDATYTGYWMLQTDTGVNIAPFTVEIVVGIPIPVSFKVTNVTTGIHDLVPKTCPYTDSFDINITSNGAGTVTYFIEQSNTRAGVTKLLNFTSAGTITIEHWMTIKVDGDYWILVYIDEPNKQYFGPFNFNVNCP